MIGDFCNAICDYLNRYKYETKRKKCIFAVCFTVKLINGILDSYMRNAGIKGIILIYNRGFL